MGMPRATVAAGIFLLTPLAIAAPTAFDQAFERLYNFDFAGAHAELDRYIAQHNQEPLPYAIRSAVNLFQELDRLGILDGEFFADDKHIIDKKKLKPDPKIRAQFLQATQEAQTRANAVLAKDPNDREALFTMCITQGVTTDYLALVEKRQIASLTPAKLSNSYAQRLLKVDPQFYDAYLTTGFTEYVVGSLPFFVRWFVRFENVEGSKEKGMASMKTVATKGRYLKGYSKILLSIAYLRDKQPRLSRDLLAELVQQYPANPLLKKELAKLDSLLGAAAN
jgi:hypothetical protein